MPSRAMIPTKMRPTLPIGAPYVPPQMRIPEPATLIGDRTGKRYVNVGDNPNGPESFQVTPPQPQAGSTELAPPGATELHPVSMAGGGSAIVGPPGPSGGQDSQGSSKNEGFWDMVARLHSTNSGSRAKVQTKSAPVSMAGGGSGSVGFDDPTYDPMRQQQQDQAAVYNSQTTEANAAATEAANRSNYYQAVSNTVAPTMQQLDQQGNVITAQQAQNAGSRAVIQATSADSGRRLGEEQQLQAASHNTGDLQAVAQAQTYRDDQQVKNQQAGVGAAQEYIQPEGDSSKAPAGTLAKIQTQGDVLGTRFNNTDKIAALQLEIQKSGVDMLGNDVAQQQALAARLGITVDQAKALVTQSEATWGQSRAAASADSAATQLATIKMNEDKNTDSTKVVYQDPVTGTSRLVSPAEAETLKAQDQRNFNQTTPGDVLYTDPYTGAKSYMTQADADQKRHDYEQQQGAVNYQNNANYAAGQSNATTQATNAQHVQWANNPASAPADWLIANMSIVDPTGNTTSSGIFTEAQVMTALINQGYTASQAYEKIHSNDKAGGTSIVIPPDSNFGH